MAQAVTGKASLLERLTQAVYLDYVLKVAGVGGFAWAFISAWSTIGVGPKAGMLAGVAAWFVGARFTKIYR